LAMEMNPRKRGRYIWPEEAKRLVSRSLRTQDKGSHAVLLHDQLLQLTGFSDHACWRFLARYGVQRPGSGKRKVWDEKVVEFVMEHGYEKAAQKFGCTRKALYALMERQGREVGHCSGHYGLNQLRKLLSVRVDVVKRWINSGLLEAIPVTYGGKPSFVVSDEQLRKFLSRHAGGMFPRRFPEKRIEFLSNFLYDVKHMDLGLLRTRESKKEGEAFRNGEYLTPDSDSYGPSAPDD
jgi:hypothetical protein